MAGVEESKGGRDVSEDVSDVRRTAIITLSLLL